MGVAVAKRRRALGLRQGDVAAQVGIAQETLSRFELRKASEFGSRKLLAVLAVLGMELEFVEIGAAGSLDELRRERAGQPRASRYTSWVVKSARCRPSLTWSLRVAVVDLQPAQTVARREHDLRSEQPLAEYVLPARRLNVRGHLARLRAHPAWQSLAPGHAQSSRLNQST